MTTDTYLLDAAVRSVMAESPHLAGIIRRKAKYRPWAVLGWDYARTKIVERYHSLDAAERHLWTAEKPAHISAAARRLAVLGHPGFFGLFVRG